ncbi:hypothetical protein ScPMuIL_005478 [Solemya velum]
MDTSINSTSEENASEEENDSKQIVPNDSGESSGYKRKEYKTYKRRWFVLAIVVILNMSNSMIWLTFAPVADLMTTFYGIDAFSVNLLSLVYLIASVPCGFIASWLLDTLGLRVSLLLSAWLNCTGALLRNISALDSIPQDAKFPLVMLGQSLAACAQPFVFTAPTKMAALWFPMTQRATANMLASMANPLGVMLANIIIPLVVGTKDTSNIPTMLWIISSPACFLAIMVTFGLCNSVPPSPPSSSADEKSEPFFVGLKKIMRNRSYLVLNISFGAGLGIITALTSFLQQILCPRGYTNDFAGMTGALLIGCGFVGALLAGLYVDRTKKFEEVVKISYGLAILCSGLFCQFSRLRDMNAAIVLSVCFLGCFGFAMYPISNELAVELTYPVAEATSTGMMFISGQLQGLVYMFVSQLLLQPLPDSEADLPTGCVEGGGSNSTASFVPQDWTSSILFLVGMGTLASILMILFVKGDYKRIRAEEEFIQEKVIRDTPINIVDS